MNALVSPSQKRAFTLNRIAVYCCYLIAVALSIKSLREPDLWWQIRTGEWIIQNKQVPHEDVFSFTYQGTPWINIKWGFEVLAAFISRTFGPESVFILQAIVSCLIVFLLIRLSKIFAEKGSTSEEIFHHSLFTAFIFSFIGIEYRFIGRPEMISHVMTVAFIYLLMRHRSNPSKKIFLLIPLQLIWANFHEAFGTGIVILLVFTVSAWIEKYLAKRKIISSEKFNPVQLSIITIASIAAICVNPNGIVLLTRPLNIFSQVFQNKYTTELLSYSSPQYWQMEAYIGIGIFALSIVGIFISTRNKKDKSPLYSRVIEKYGIGYLVLLIAFFYLALTAYRNIIFLVLISFPAFVVAIVQFCKWIKKRIANKLLPAFSFLYRYGAIAVSITFYILIVSGKYYSLTNRRDKFGLRVLSNFNPVGAADYISKNNLVQKKCFSDYLTSSYLLWKLQPNFKTFIDLRDLDIFPPEFFDRFIEAANSPQAFHRLDSVYNFDYVVLYQSQFTSLHNYLYNDSVYAMTYADPVAAVYEKTDNFTREDIFSSCSIVPVSNFAKAINFVLNPFYSSTDNINKDNDYIAAAYYINAGRMQIALQRAEKYLQSSKEKFKANEMLGRVYYTMSLRDSLNQPDLLGKAEEYYRQSIKENDEYATAYLGLGNVEAALKNFKGAITNFEKCLKYDSDNLSAYISSADSYKNLIDINPAHEEEYTQKMLELYLKADNLNPGDAHIQANIGFMYFKLKDCSHASVYLSKVLDSNSLTLPERRTANQCLKNCGQ